MAKKEPLFPKVETKAGPDYVRIAADIERSRARTFEVYTGPRACQERTCMLRAVPGLEFCNKHAQMPEDQVRRVGVPIDWKRVGELSEDHS